MTDDKKTDDKQIDGAVAAFQKIADQRARDRRERIAMVVLAGLAANPNRNGIPFVADIREAIDAADELMKELDKEGGR